MARLMETHQIYQLMQEIIVGSKIFERKNCGKWKEWQTKNTLKMLATRVNSEREAFYFYRWSEALALGG